MRKILFMMFALAVVSVISSCERNEVPSGADKGDV